MPKKLALMLMLFLLPVVLTGCNFWDWLAGVPVSGSGGRVAVDDAAPAGTSTSTDDEAGDQPADDASDRPAHGVEGGPPPGGEGDASGDSDGPFEPVEIRPVDQAGDDPSLSAFKARLLEIIKNKDVEGLLSVVAPDIKNDFGGNDGIEAFKEKWTLDSNPANSELWTILGDILDLGGVFLDEDRNIFVAPYVYALYSDIDLDPFSHLVVTGEGVNVRAAPAVDSPVLDSVSYQVVRQLPTYGEELPEIELDGRTYRWAKVQLPSGTVGYMVDRYLWSPVGYRLAFSKTGDDWRLIFLVAGD